MRTEVRGCSRSVDVPGNRPTSVFCGWVVEMSDSRSAAPVDQALLAQPRMLVAGRVTRSAGRIRVLPTAARGVNFRALT